MQIENVKIVMKPVNEIIPYWRNPRRNDKTVDALVEVISKSGFNVPLVIDKNNVVVKGHARLRAAKRLGMTEVPCIVSEASEDVIKADRIADNKIQELSRWDFGKLNMELDRLGDKMDFMRLFRPEENPVKEAASHDIPTVEFKPAGLQFWDGGYDGEPQAQAIPNYVQTGTTPADVLVDEDVHAHVDVPYEQEVQQAQQPHPQPHLQPRQLKTLCPYCGKVVIINI